MGDGGCEEGGVTRKEQLVESAFADAGGPADDDGAEVGWDCRDGVLVWIWSV